MRKEIIFIFNALFFLSGVFINAQVSRLDSIIIAENKFVYIDEKYLRLQEEFYYPIRIKSICKIKNGYIFEGVVLNDSVRVYIFSPDIKSQEYAGEFIEVNKTYQIKLTNYYKDLKLLTFNKYYYGSYDIFYLLLSDKLLPVPSGKCFLPIRIYISRNIMGIQYVTPEKLEIIENEYKSKEKEIKNFIVEFLNSLVVKRTYYEYVDTCYIKKIEKQKGKDYYSVGLLSYLIFKRGDEIIFELKNRSKFLICRKKPNSRCEVCKSLIKKVMTDRWKIKKITFKKIQENIDKEITKYLNLFDISDNLMDSLNLRLLYIDGDIYTIEVKIRIKHEYKKNLIFVLSLKKNENSYKVIGVKYDLYEYYNRMKYE